MTTTYKSDKTCTICKKPSEHFQISSTSRFGPNDLDTRPPMMERFTIDQWVERCPHCGYCNSDIEESIDGVENIINGRVYKQILENADYAKLTNSFLCQSYIYEKLEVYTEAIWAAIHAAWASDDNNSRRSAINCRLKAIELIKKLWGNGDKLFEHPGADYILLGDLLRRVGEFNKAQEIIQKGINLNPAEAIMNDLLIEKTLVEKHYELCGDRPRVEELLNKWKGLK